MGGGGAGQCSGAGRGVLLRLHVGGAQGGQHLLDVRAPARLQHQLDLHVLRRQQREGALVVNRKN